MSIDPEKEKSADRVRDVLVKSRLWLSSPIDFNDPFDMSANMTVSDDPRERRERVKTLLKEMGLRYSEREKRVKKFNRKPVDELTDFLASSYRKNIEEVGIFSFSADPKNILMWSHYAQHHTGICIQFELARDFPMLCSAVSVDYSSVYPEITWGKKNYRDMFAKTVLNKHEGWRYEKEYRIVRPGEAHTYLPINPQAVVGIITGCRMLSDYESKLKDILQERLDAKLPSLKLYFAGQHKSKYKLSILRKSPHI